MNDPFTADSYSILAFFISRRSAPDVLKYFTHKKKRISKEITEALPVLWYMKTVTMKEHVDPEKIVLVDACSGNTPYLSILAVFNTKWSAIPVDVLPPSPHLTENPPRRLVYTRTVLGSGREHEDVLAAVEKLGIENPYIILAGIHCCKKLSIHAINLAAKIGAKHVFLVPCCWIGGKGINTYDEWVKYLEDKLREKGYEIVVSRKVRGMRSDKNHLIHGRKTD